MLLQFFPLNHPSPLKDCVICNRLHPTKWTERTTCSGIKIQESTFGALEVKTIRFSTQYLKMVNFKMAVLFPVKRWAIKTQGDAQKIWKRESIPLYNELHLNLLWAITFESYMDRRILNLFQSWQVFSQAIVNNKCKHMFKKYRKIGIKSSVLYECMLQSFFPAF